MFHHHHRRGGKRLLRRPRARRPSTARLAALFLCLSLLAGFRPAPARAGAAGPKLSERVTFETVTLHYADGTEAGGAVPDRALLKKDDRLVLRYTYTISEEQCKNIESDTSYFLEVSPHLTLPEMPDGSPLTVGSGEDAEQFGRIYADGASAWVRFDRNAAGTGTVLSKYGELQNAFFYLNCGRAGAVPEGERPLEGQNNLYAMKFEDGSRLTFGYAENEPVSARAVIRKDGSLKDKTIDWSIAFTPWQNPTEQDGVTPDTPFELRDTIDTSLHELVPGSVVIDGTSVPISPSRAEIPEGAEAYALVETPEAEGEAPAAGPVTLILGGSKFSAGTATQGSPAVPFLITYRTVIHDDLLLPGGKTGRSVTNAADLFAERNGVFNSLNITGSKSVLIPQPIWLTKEGHTTRHKDGTGSTTDWTVTFQPNGFDFAAENKLILHDQLPQGSEPVLDSLYVNDVQESVTVGGDNSFTLSPIVTNGNQPVKITYQTHVPEVMYDNGTSLGSNTAWFTFSYNDTAYETPRAVTPIGSGDGSGTPGTATLVKTNAGYNAANRSIDWTVKINPHQANLHSGTFTDDLKIIPPCTVDGHTGGLELVNGTAGVEVLVDDAPLTDADKTLISLAYSQQVLTVTVGEIGARTVTLRYTTKVCDPCVFAANTAGRKVCNTISTKDMHIGSSSTEARSASASSDVTVGAAVLTKKAPVYDYASGLMRWTVEVNAAGLSMEDVVLTDTLPAGLTYHADSLGTSPAIPGASASAEGQELTIRLGTAAGKTTVTFDTDVDPELLGFGGGQPVTVANTIRMNGQADGVTFAEVSHDVTQTFANHGLVKTNTVDNQQELISYEVLVNPYRLALPENPALVDTLDKRLQLDTDTLRFYKANLTGTTAGREQKPVYEKEGSGQELAVTSMDLAENRFTVRLPISEGSRDAYVLTYTADIADHQKGGYTNSVRFDGGTTLLLGGEKGNSAAVGGGGGGGGGVAARRSTIAIVKTDSETGDPLPGVEFQLYQWDSANNARGLPYAQGITNDRGALSFQVKPEAVYELVEAKSRPGYSSGFGCAALPEGVSKTDSGLLITAGAARTELALALTNEAHTTDLVFKLLNEENVPMADETVLIFDFDPTGQVNPVPRGTAPVAPDGTVTVPGIRRGTTCYLQIPGGVYPIVVPLLESADPDPKITLPDGTTVPLSEETAINGVTDPGKQPWTLTVHKVISGGTAPLAGAAIQLYADRDCTVLIGTKTSAPDGTVTFSGLIQGQHYWVKESEAPAGYVLDPTVCEVDGETAFDVTIANTPEQQPTNPNPPDHTGTGNTPGTSGRPGSSGKPGTPSIADTPGRPGTSNDPGTPGATGEPGTPGTPGATGSPGTTGTPGTAGGPGASGTPGTAGGPGASGTPGAAGKPGTSEDSGGGDVSTGGPKVPPTGDSTPLWAAAALFSGTLLAALTVLHLPALQKRRKHPTRR